MSDPEGEFDPSDLNDEELARTLQTMREDMDEIARVLEGEGEAMSAISDYLADNGSPDDGVDAMLEWVRANTDADIDAVESAATEYLAEADAEDLSGTTVGEFQAYIESQAGEGEEPEEGAGAESPEVPPEEAEATMSDLEAAKGVISEISTHLADVKDLLSAREDTIEEQFDELSRRLSELEDEPVKRSLTGEQPGEFYNGEGEEAEATAHDDVYL